VLGNVNLNVRKGDIIAVIGPNGSGKSSLLRAIAGALKPVEGEVRVRSGARIFYLPQLPDFAFMFRKVKRELEYSAQKGLGRDALNAILSKEQWIHNLMDESPYRLSHGQRRRLGLIIAMLHGAEILLLDEPTTGLDIGFYQDLCRDIINWRSRGAVVMATHDSRLVAECSNRSVILDSGRAREIPRDKAVQIMEGAWRS
jgi:ABC-type multidrug transport system ATPase subunit